MEYFAFGLLIQCQIIVNGFRLCCRCGRQSCFDDSWNIGEFDFSVHKHSYGSFIGGIVDFLIVAIVVFIVMKKFLGFMQNMRKAEEKTAEPPAPPAPPEPSAEEKLLTEIRDLLKK